jgi:ABC-type multidrug transport system ATPase subunit
MSIFELFDPKFLPHHGCDVNLHLSPGEVLVLWGDNGIGKTTLLQRFYQHSSLDAVMVDQKALDFFYDRTVKVILDFFSQFPQSDFSHRKFLLLCEMFDLRSKDDRLLSQLSGGELQMLKLTLTLCSQKSIYFLDEPFQYLDLSRKKQLVDFLNDQRNEGATILMIEHYLEGIPWSWKKQRLVLDQNWLKVSP